MVAANESRTALDFKWAGKDMKLSELINKNEIRAVATVQNGTDNSVAKVATVTVANSDIQKVVICDKADIQLLKASPKPVSEDTQWNHDATLMAIIQKSNLTQLATVTVATSATIERLKCETDVNPEIQKSVIVEIPDSQFFEPNQEKVSGDVFFADDRRHCSQCFNLSAGRCLAAWRGEIVAARQYRPIDDLPRHYYGYVPKSNDPDQLLGKQRWPGLNQLRRSYGKT